MKTHLCQASYPCAVICLLFTPSCYFHFSRKNFGQFPPAEAGPSCFCPPDIQSTVWKSSPPPFPSQAPPPFLSSTPITETKVRSVTPAAHPPPPPCSLTYRGGLAEHKQWSSHRSPPATPTSTTGSCFTGAMKEPTVNTE